MISTLKFVQGAVGKKDLVPALSHFRIKGSRITGFNGKLSISAPIALDVDCCPKADPFVRAVQACSETAQLHLTPSAKLSIRSGKFRAHVETLPSDNYPDVLPEGITVPLHGDLLPAFKTLYSFTAEDASRPWAAGILLNGNSAFATNNVVIAECWLGYHFPYRANIPRAAIKEMIRINEEPVSMQLSVHSATFFYEGDRWLRTQLNSTDWPDVAGVFAKVPPFPNPYSVVPAELWDALETIAPFVDDLSRVYVLEGKISTAHEEGTSVELEGLPSDGLYNHKMLSLLKGIAKFIDFEVYPAPVPWFSDTVRGLIMPMRDNNAL